MKTITNWKQLQAVESLIDIHMKEELERYFIELISELPDEEDYKSHDIKCFGIIGVIEASDDIHGLQELGNDD